MVVRLRLLDQNHVEKSHHVAYNCASLWSRVSAQNCEALLVTQLAAALVADDHLGCKRLSAFAETSVWHPILGSRILVSSTRGSGKARRSPERLHFFDFRLI